MTSRKAFLGVLCICAVALSACGTDDNAKSTGGDNDAGVGTDTSAAGADAGAADAGASSSGGGSADAGSGSADAGSGAADAGGSKMPPNTAPSAETKKLWALITDYAKWTEFDETKKMPQSKSHQNMFVHAYYNKVVADFIKTGKKPPLPEGSILVKANFKTKDAPKPAALTVMHKLKSGKWYWLKAMGNGNVFLGPDGKTPAEGTAVKTCIGCHTNMAPSGNDLVATHVFGK